MESKTQNKLIDTFGREHSYLRISITERCNLRCKYCMPVEGIKLSPKKNIMTADEIYSIAKTFVEHGVDKIRLTGGEPLIRKDAPEIIERLASLPTTLAITTNGVNVDQFIPLFKKCGIKKLNLSLDTLNAEKNHLITRRNYFDRIYKNILLLVEEDFEVKVNCVLMKGENDDEIIDFINLTKKMPLAIRFIEFMPFDGNRWNLNQMVSLEEILKKAVDEFGIAQIQKLKDPPTDTAKHYRIKNYRGNFAIISSVTNPFCDGCNRIRLTANGRLKNCLFSSAESDILSLLRKNKPIVPAIKEIIKLKFKTRSGMDTIEQFNDPEIHTKNRSMIAIGG